MSALKYNSSLSWIPNASRTNNTPTTKATGGVRLNRRFSSRGAKKISCSGFALGIFYFTTVYVDFHIRSVHEINNTRGGKGFVGDAFAFVGNIAHEGLPQTQINTIAVEHWCGNSQV